jgi:hypothetical protein
MGLPLVFQRLAKLKKAVHSPSTRRTVYILLICLIAIILSTKGVTDEGIIAPGGDMPRHMMNGVYFHDILRDLPLGNLIQYTIEYFARYPALSLGHHPLLFGLIQAPFYAAFGISVFSARLVVVLSLLVAGVMWFLLIGSLYGDDKALLSSLLLVTTPFVVGLSRVVMAEIPTVAAIIATFYFLCQYCRSEEKRYLVAFALVSVISVYAKHTAIFMFPFYLLYFILNKGVKSLIKKDVIVFSIIIIVLVLPLVPITLKFSQYNVSWTRNVASETLKSVPFWRYYHVLQSVWERHLTIPVLVLSLASICVSLYKREKRGISFILWIVVFYTLSVYTGAPTARHTVYWIPAFCLLAATLVDTFENRPWKIVVSALIVSISAYQFAIGFRWQPEYAHGYEDAAKYVVENWKGDSVLYGSKVDTGYFIFFIRKHDEKENMVVLRANKILATSALNIIVEDRVQSRSEIYDTLDKFGTSFVVLEDVKFRSVALEWLREEVKSSRFVLRKRIPVRSRHPALRGVDLAIYEYRGQNRAREDAVLNMDVPLMGDSISVRFSDLIRKDSR